MVVEHELVKNAMVINVCKMILILPDCVEVSFWTSSGEPHGTGVISRMLLVLSALLPSSSSTLLVSHQLLRLEV